MPQGKSLAKESLLLEMFHLRHLKGSTYHRKTRPITNFWGSGQKVPRFDHLGKFGVYKARMDGR